MMFQELNFRPMKFDDFIGQVSLKENLKIYIDSSKKRNESLDHILLYGPPGTGKTTLANIVANELETKFIHVSAPNLEKPGDLIAYLTSLEPGNVFFIDEIHRIPKQIEEILYEAMEDYRITVIINRETDSKAINIDLPPFTLVAATTRPGMLSAPLRNRFGITEELQKYANYDIINIIKRSSIILGIQLDELAAEEIAKRSRNTPRIANYILKRVRDHCVYKNANVINKKIAVESLNKLNIDDLGLLPIDIKYLSCIKNRCNGGPVGIETISTLIGENKDDLLQMVEPYLLEIGLIERLRNGRVITERGMKHISRM